MRIRASQTGVARRAMEQEAKQLRLKELLTKDPEITRAALVARLGVSAKGLLYMARRLGVVLPKDQRGEL